MDIQGHRGQTRTARACVTLHITPKHRHCRGSGWHSAGVCFDVLQVWKPSQKADLPSQHTLHRGRAFSASPESLTQWHMCPQAPGQQAPGEDPLVLMMCRFHSSYIAFTVHVVEVRELTSGIDRFYDTHLKTGLKCCKTEALAAGCLGMPQLRSA